MNSSFENSCEDFSNHSLILAIDSFREVYIPFISSIGLIGNILSLFVLRKMKDCFHRLLFALAVSDIIVPTFCNKLLFMKLLKHTSKMNVFGKVANAVLESGFAGTGWMTVSISIDRFLGICYPMDFPPASRKARYFILPVIILVVFDFSLSAVLFGLFGPTSQIIVFYAHILVQYVMPAAIVLVLNTIIIRSVIKIHSKRSLQERSAKIPSSALVLIAVVLVYIISWAPFYILDFTAAFQPTQSGCKGPNNTWVDRYKQA